MHSHHLNIANNNHRPPLPPPPAILRETKRPSLLPLPGILAKVAGEKQNAVTTAKIGFNTQRVQDEHRRQESYCKSTFIVPGWKQNRSKRRKKKRLTTELLLQELVKRPIRIATAPTAQRAYINTFLFISTSVALLCIAALAYPIFYYSYVPKKVVSLPIHLQYK